MIEINGVKLVPAKLPKTGWPAVVEAFLGTGQECVVIESEKPAKNLYMALAKVVKGQPCKAVVAEDRCYLVRIK